jgi:hypothetical protein
MPWVRGWPEQVELTWEDFVESLVNVERTDQPKDLKELRPNKKTGKEEMQIVASLPGYCPCKLRDPELGRTKKNVESVSCLVLDFDDITVAEWQTARGLLEGFEWCFHSTYKHQPISGKMRYRVAVKTDRPVPGTHWPQFIETMAKEFGGAYDESCKDASRFFYSAYAPMDGPEPESGHFRGKPIPVDAVLSYIATPPEHREPTKSKIDHFAIADLIPPRLERLENENVRAGYLGIQAALDGRPFAVRGERHSTLLYMSGILARAFPRNTPEEIIAPFRHSLPDEGDGIPADEALLAQLERDLEKNAIENEARVEEIVERGGRERSYTFDEVDAFVKRLGLRDREQLARNLIVTSGADFYVLEDGDYVYLGGKDRAENAIASYLAPYAATLPIAVGEETRTGWQDKSLKVLAKQYGCYARKVVKNLSLQQSRVEAGVLHFAICPRAPLTPKFNSSIDAWLSSWSDPESLKDWLATAPRLEKPTAALVLGGGEMTGKSSIAKGLSALYGARYTPMQQVTASFNDAIARCPIVFAEETVPWEYRRDTGLLKELITSDSQQLRAKFQDSADLLGAVRVVIAKNDHKLFEAGEALTENTVGALSKRLLFIDTGHTPAPYFEPKEIAQHILYLEQTRVVGESARGGLWVSGKPSKLHYRMRAFTSKVSISVCQWLHSFIQKPVMSGDTAGKMFRADSTGLHVAPQLVYEKYENYCGKETRQPTHAQVAEAMAGLGTRNGHLVTIDLNVLAEYGDGIMSELCTVDKLKSAIENAGVQMQKRAN